MRVYESADEAADALRDALLSADDEIEVTLVLPRRTAEKVLTLLKAEGISGAVVVPVRDLYSTTEAARMLGISRPTLMKLIDTGEIESEMVGTHHRIPAAGVVAYQRVRQLNRDRATEAMSEFAGRVHSGYQSNVTFYTDDAQPGNAATNGIAK